MSDPTRPGAAAGSVNVFDDAVEHIRQLLQRITLVRNDWHNDPARERWQHPEPPPPPPRMTKRERIAYDNMPCYKGVWFEGPPSDEWVANLRVQIGRLHDDLRLEFDALRRAATEYLPNELKGLFKAEVTLAEVAALAFARVPLPYPWSDVVGVEEYAAIASLKAIGHVNDLHREWSAEMATGAARRTGEAPPSGNGSFGGRVSTGGSSSDLDITPAPVANNPRAADRITPGEPVDQITTFEAGEDFGLQVGPIRYKLDSSERQVWDVFREMCPPQPNKERPVEEVKKAVNSRALNLKWGINISSKANNILGRIKIGFSLNREVTASGLEVFRWGQVCS